jgi:hypothetical protein
VNDATDNGIAIGLGELQQRVYRPLLLQCQLEYEQWLQHKPPERPGVHIPNSIDFLKSRISREMWLLETLRRLHARFVRSIKTSSKLEDQKQVILNFARDLGATPSDLEKDAAAFARWFGADAVTDRYHRRHSRHEQYMAFLLDRLAAVAANAAQDFRDADDQTAFWNLLNLESVAKPLLVYDGDVRLKLAAFRCLADVLSALSPEIQEQAVDDTTLQYIYRAALQHQQPVWIQCAALELLVTLSWASFARALEQRLLQPASGDDLFVRRRAVRLLARHLHRLACGQALIRFVLSDPSPFVRQALPKVVVQCPVSVAVPALEQLIVKDDSPQVRAATWLEWPALVADSKFRDDAVRLFREVGPQETDEFVLRVLCLVAERTTRELRCREDPSLAAWQSAAEQVLLTLRCSAASVKARRWASQSLEFIWSECNAKARALRERFAAFVPSLPPGRKRRLPLELTQAPDPVFVGRVWSVVCRNDYDVQLQVVRRGYKVIRGHVFGFRWWRWWHEFRHPSPDKRQAFPHTIGRLFDGQLHIPSAIMAELAQTKVPGEPLHISAEGGWRPYLPLPDELTSCVELGRSPRPFRIFTSEGITSVTPPRGWRRWRAAFRLTWHFREYAEKRNWLDSMQEPASAYVRALTELGFSIRFDTYADGTGGALPADPMVLRFFPQAPADEVDAAVGLAAELMVEPGLPVLEPVVRCLQEEPRS